MKKNLVTLLLAGFIGACSVGPDKGNGGGTDGYTHNDLAQLFIKELNLKSDVKLELIKSSTNQFDYVVVYDPSTNNYDAINIGQYRAGMDPIAYLADHRNYVDLDVIPGRWESSEDYDSTCDCIETSRTWIKDTYRDRSSGMVFEKTAPSNKDRLKMAALEEAVSVGNAAETLNAQFGMSMDRSFEVAKIAMAWNKIPKERMTNADHDRFAKDILGHNITEYQAAAKAKASGNPSDLKRLVGEAAELNGISPEHANQIVGNMFGLNL